MTDGRCPLLQRFLQAARRDPEQPALLGPRGAVLAKRRELAAAIAAIRESMAPLLPPGRPVALSLPNGLELVAAFGALRALGLPV
ncbi:MAG: long-chain fatty acid--CoA ligase, partial [Holophagae bacterium]|nr:long-chain fatty acid--CoA ligase [Holophagae bacterium]